MAVAEPSAIAKLYLERGRFTGALLARNTEIGYGYDWRAFQRWCAGMQRVALPASPETVSLYLTDQLQKGKKVSTAMRRASAIGHQHRAEGMTSPFTSEVRQLLEGARRLRNEPLRQMRPISLEHLRAIAEKLLGLKTTIAIRNRAVLIVGFASALRRSNLAALTLDDVEIEDRGIIVHVRREKQDQEGKGRLIGLPRGKHVATCPVRALRAWLSYRGWAPGPLFTRLDWGHEGEGLPMRGETIARTVKACVRLIGLDAGMYGGHSLRAGFVTAAGEAGVGELLIADQTGHRSMSVLRRYFRRSDLFRTNACSSIGL